MAQRSDQPAESGGGGDATRRTWLANERTWLAWVRTGLTATAVALAVGKVLPDIAGEQRRWPYEVVGVGYAIYGVVLVAYGFLRRQEVEEAIAVGSYRSPHKLAMAVFAMAAVVLGIGAGLLVVLT